MTEKACTKCNQTKPVDQFSKDKQKKDGLRSHCKPCSRVYTKAHYEANKEEYNAKSAEWAARNIDRRREIARNWQSRNLPNHAAAEHRRRARQFCAVPQRWRKSECTDTQCYWCGVDLSTVETHVEHIMPISLGGPAVPSNEAPACADCNLRKNNKHPLIWIAQQF